MAKLPQITHDDVQEAFTDALRKYVGRGKMFSIAEIADATGIEERTVRAHHGNEACPELTRLMAYINVLPAEFSNSILMLAGLGHAGPLAAAPVEAFDILAGIVDRAHALTEGMRDADLNLQEMVDLQPRISQGVTELRQFDAMLTRKIESIRHGRDLPVRDFREKGDI